MASKRSSRLLIDEEPLQVLPSLAEAVGLNSAIFLQQLHYWLKKSHHTMDGKRWVYNTYEQWHDQFPFWGSESIRKLVASLEARMLIETTDRFNTDRRNRTKWYTINYEVLNAMIHPEENEAPEEVPGGAEARKNLPGHPEDSSASGPEDLTGSNIDQRLPETTDRDSDLQSGDGQKMAAPENENGQAQKIQNPGEYGVAKLMERVHVARSRGAPIHDPPNRGNMGRFFAERFKTNNIEILELTLDYLVAKASGEVDGEPKAWCGFDTALDKVLAGWRPAIKASTRKLEGEELEQVKRRRAQRLREMDEASQERSKKEGRP